MIIGRAGAASVGVQVGTARLKRHAGTAREVGLLLKTAIAALQSLAGYPTRPHLRALRCVFSAVQRVRVHSVNRP